MSYSDKLSDLVSDLSAEVFVTLRDFVQEERGRDVPELISANGAFVIAMALTLFMPLGSDLGKEIAMEGFEALVRDMRRSLEKNLSDPEAIRKVSEAFHGRAN